MSAAARLSGWMRVAFLGRSCPQRVLIITADAVFSVMVNLFDLIEGLMYVG